MKPFGIFRHAVVQESSAEIAITDVTPTAFKAMLLFIYRGVAALHTLQGAWQLWYAAKKYMLDSLEEKCRKVRGFYIFGTVCCFFFHFSNVALLHIDEPFVLSAHVDTICLPTLDDLRDSYWGEGCVATGWGKDSFGERKTVKLSRDANLTRESLKQVPRASTRW